MDAALQACRDYDTHLKSIATRLPEPTKAFAMAPWYGDPTHHDCPHDSWLMSLSVDADAAASKDHGLNLTVRLLGAFHDRILTFRYFNVAECSFEIKRHGKHNLGDWLKDEFDITDQGCISHEILWQFGKPWKIVSEEVEFSAENRPQKES
ncbi:MAG: hypothetical protein JF609_09270 [Verrucomicrobia bacterium]|nr:hypothetical protein [Verrucomicrobiota bacterium]